MQFLNVKYEAAISKLLLKQNGKKIQKDFFPIYNLYVITVVFYNIGSYAQSVRNFACFKKVYLLAHKNGGKEI